MIIKVPVVATINTDCGNNCDHHTMRHCNLFDRNIKSDFSDGMFIYYRCSKCLEAEKKASKDNA